MSWNAGAFVRHMSSAGAVCLFASHVCFSWAGEDKEEAEEQWQGQRSNFSHNPQHHLRLSVRQWEGAEFGCLQHCGPRYYTPICDPLGFALLLFNELKITVYRWRSAVYVCAVAWLLHKKMSIKSQDAFPCAVGFKSASFWSQAVSFKTE